jgi:ribulose-phosphate 3-epimerase
MPHNNTLLAPSILSADFLNLQDEIRQCESAGADWIHIDVMDGHFVPNLTMGPFIVEACRRATRLPLDVHLMIEQPERLLEAFARAGADHLIVHVETCPQLADTLQQIRSLNCKAVVTLNPETPVNAIESVLPMVDGVLVMSVHPGYSAQSFIQGSTAKVADVRSQLDALGSTAWLEVDGGVNADLAPQLKDAGATVLVSANAIFHHPMGITAGVQALRSALEPAGES